VQRVGINHQLKLKLKLNGTGYETSITWLDGGACTRRWPGAGATCASLEAYAKKYS
jgi:hypothetical protein